MATESQPPTTIPSDDNSRNQEVIPPTIVENRQDAPAEVAEQISAPSVLVNSEPMREEDQDPPPSTQTTAVTQDSEKTPSSIQPQTLQPSAATPAESVASVRSRWSRAIFCVALLAAFGGTVLLWKSSVILMLKSRIRKLVFGEETEPAEKSGTKGLAQEAAAAAKSAAAAAADAAKASQEMAISKKEEKKYFTELMKVLDMQLHELKSMSNSIRKLEGEIGALLIMAMVQRGEKPSDITEIGDSPPNPNRQPSNPRLAPRPKPWEVNQSRNGNSYLTNSKDDPTPWWERKNPIIAEIESHDEPKSSSCTAQSYEPPRPPVRRAMPEAAEAIQRPKSSARELTDEEKLLDSRSSDWTDELQSSIPSSSEIVEP